MTLQAEVEQLQKKNTYREFETWQEEMGQIEYYSPPSVTTPSPTKFDCESKYIEFIGAKTKDILAGDNIIGLKKMMTFCSYGFIFKERPATETCRLIDSLMKNNTEVFKLSIELMLLKVKSIVEKKINEMNYTTLINLILLYDNDYLSTSGKAFKNILDYDDDDIFDDHMRVRTAFIEWFCSLHQLDQCPIELGEQTIDEYKNQVDKYINSKFNIEQKKLTQHLAENLKSNLEILPIVAPITDEEHQKNFLENLNFLTAKKNEILNKVYACSTIEEINSVVFS